MGLMMSSNVKSKKEILIYDENGGLMFMKNWPPTLRWICLFPVVIITFIIVKFLFLAPVLNIIEKVSDLLSFYTDAITSGIVYFAIVDVAASVAPKNRVSTSLVTAFVLGILVIVTTFMTFNAILSKDYMLSRTHLMIGLGIVFISNVFGILGGVFATKDRQKNTSKDNIIK